MPIAHLANTAFGLLSLIIAITIALAIWGAS